MQLALPSPHVSPAARARARATESTSAILVWMVVAIAAIGAITLWDEERESSAALQDFAENQATIAQSSALALESRLAAVDATARTLAEQGPLPVHDTSGMRVSQTTEAATSDVDDPSFVHRTITTRRGDSIDVAVPLETITNAVRKIEQPGEVRVLVRVPGRNGFEWTSNAMVQSAPLERAIEHREAWVRLRGADASALGLPPRTAMAGLATVQDDGMGTWSVAVVATAVRERDRESRAMWRLVLGFSIASGLVLAFGSLARRKQRKELDLARDLALADATRERDEQLVRADKLATLGALATGIAHEVATPLGVIVGRAEQVLPKLAGDERAERSLNAIVEQADRIGRVVRAFLSLARGGTPMLEHMAPVTVARAALDLVEHRFARAGVSVRSRMDETLPLIACDPRLLEQALVNLLLNACDASARGGHVELVVRGDRERVAFIVIDDGAGITQAAALRATEPFFTTKPAGEGTGFGLTIANEIVKHHHGELSLSRRDGERGTRAVIAIAAAATKSDGSQ